MPDHAYADGKIALWAQDRLRRISSDNSTKKTPFFLAVGFLKPHLPFIAPRKYWDLYQRESLPLPNTNGYPEGMPNCARMTYYEGETYNEIPRLGETIPEETNRLLLHGYLACISYIDAQIGKLMQTLQETGLDKNTIVVVWGDHGFHTGDHGMWGKHTNWEQATRVPLIIKAPGMKEAGISDSPVECIDVFPTLCELAGVSIPNSLDGKSLVPVLRNPRRNCQRFRGQHLPANSA